MTPNAASVCQEAGVERGSSEYLIARRGRLGIADCSQDRPVAQSSDTRAQADRSRTRAGRRRSISTRPTRSRTAATQPEARRSFEGSLTVTDHA